MTDKRPNRLLGPPHDAFWAWCAQGELRIQECDACGALSWPAAPACERCGGASLDWKRMSGRGKLVSWCSFERDYYGGALPLPWDTILVALEEGPLFIANPKGFTFQECALGLPVRLAFIACEDSAGLYKLPVFERA